MDSLLDDLQHIRAVIDETLERVIQKDMPDGRMRLLLWDISATAGDMRKAYNKLNRGTNVL